MMAEEAKPLSTPCGICNDPLTTDKMWILDECSCKFHKDCIRKFLEKEILVSVNVGCPVKGCGKPVSMRDQKELGPKMETKGGGGGGLFGGKFGSSSENSKVNQCSFTFACSDQ